MRINLSLQIVDSYVDMVLSKQSDLIFKRRKIAYSEKIVYLITFLEYDKFEFKITLYKIDVAITEIAFPVRIPYYDAVARSPWPAVGLIAASHDYIPTSFRMKAEERKYRVCNAIWLQL